MRQRHNSSTPQGNQIFKKMRTRPRATMQDFQEASSPLEGLIHLGVHGRCECRIGQELQRAPPEPQQEERRARISDIEAGYPRRSIRKEDEVAWLERCAWSRQQQTRSSISQQRAPVLSPSTSPRRHLCGTTHKTRPTLDMTLRIQSRCRKVYLPITGTYGRRALDAKLSTLLHFGCEAQSSAGPS